MRLLMSVDAKPSSEAETEAAPVKAKPVAKSVTAPKAKPKIQAKAAKPAPKVVRPGTARWEIHPPAEGSSLRGFLSAVARVR